MEIQFMIKSENETVKTEQLLANLEEFRRLAPKFFINFRFAIPGGFFGQWSRVFFTSNAYEYTMKNNLTGEVINSLSVEEHDSIPLFGKNFLYHKMETKPILDDWFEVSCKLIKLDKPHYFVLGDRNVYEFEVLLTKLSPTFFDKLETESVVCFKLHNNSGSNIFYLDLQEKYQEFIDKFVNALRLMDEEITKIYNFYNGNFV